MKSALRGTLRRLLHFLGKYPSLKRAIVNVIYRFPALDSTLRNVAHRVVHPDAVLDVDLTCLPHESRRTYERMRGSTPS
jgi:hypothetical protein